MTERKRELLKYLDDLREPLKCSHLNAQRILRLVSISTEVLKFRYKLKLEMDLDLLVDDIMRAVVVLLHATFEDFLREIARLRLSECPAEVLDEIPLAGISIIGQPRKFLLGTLHGHRGKSIDELIKESIDEFLSKKSFNNSTDVVKMLEKIGIDPSGVSKYFSALDQMMRRRHQIVHKADQEGSPGNWHLAPIDPRDLWEWTRNTYDLIRQLLWLAFPADVQKFIIAHPKIKKEFEEQIPDLTN